MEWKTKYITELLRECSRIALGYYHAPGTTVKSDHTLVTKADRAIEAFLESKLSRPGEGSFLIGEETVADKPSSYIDGAFREVAWIIDPIDGTAPYAHHIPTWGISIARMEGGTLTDGAIYLPVTDELFITHGSAVEYGSLEGEREPIGALPSMKERMTTGMIALTQDVAKGSGIDVRNPVQALGCAVLPLAYLILGRYLAYLGTVKLWDCAGALPMLDRAGIVSILDDGTPVDTGVDERRYRIADNDADRWKLRGRLVCGATPEITDYLRSSLR